MENKTKVRIPYTDTQHGEWVKGDEGYIDGYATGSSGVMYAAVVIPEKNKIVLIKPMGLEVIIDSGWTHLTTQQYGI